MEKVKENLEKEGHKIYCYTVDVTDRKNVYKNADLVKQEVGVVDILINNAGIVCGNTFLDIPDYMIEKTFQVNILSNYWVNKDETKHIWLSFKCCSSFFFFRLSKHFYQI